MQESQGRSNLQNTKEAPPKRDNKNPKARHKLSSEECLRSYLTGIPEKSWKAPSLSSVKYALKKLYKLLMVILLLFSAIFIIMILFPKLIPITLIIITIIIALLTIILVIMIAIASIKYAIEYAIEYIILIFSFRKLVRILPALINELKGKLPKDVEEDAQKYLQNFPCMERFRGNAAKALSRISQSTFILVGIDSILLSAISFLAILSILFLIPILIILHYLHYLLGLKIPSTSILISILITGIKSAITNTVVDAALWVLGTILSIVMGLFLFSSQARFDADTLRFVYDVKFTVLGWFVVAVFLIIISLIIISVKVPPIIAIIITVPVITALIISITVYVILASAVLDYMQLARNNQGEN